MGASLGGTALLPAAAEATPEAVSPEELPRLCNGDVLLELVAAGVRAGSGEFHPTARLLHWNSVPSALK